MSDNKSNGESAEKASVTSETASNITTSSTPKTPAAKTTSTATPTATTKTTPSTTTTTTTTPSTPTNTSDLSEFVVRIRGIPWSCSKEEIVKFLTDCKIKNGHSGIYFTIENGRPSGEAFIELSTSEDLERAKARHLNYIGDRYIEVFESSAGDLKEFLNLMKTGKYTKNATPKKSFKEGGGGLAFDFNDHNDALYIRIRGIPFDCAPRDVYKFFEGIEIARDAIKMPLDRQGRSVGDAFIRFATASEADRSLLKQKEKMGRRYIEVFRSSAIEYFNVEPFGPIHGGPRRMPKGMRGPPHRFFAPFGPPGGPSPWINGGPPPSSRPFWGPGPGPDEMGPNFGGILGSGPNQQPPPASWNPNNHNNAIDPTQAPAQPAANYGDPWMIDEQHHRNAPPYDSFGPPAGPAAGSGPGPERSNPSIAAQPNYQSVNESGPPPGGPMRSNRSGGAAGKPYDRSSASQGRDRFHFYRPFGQQGGPPPQFDNYRSQERPPGPANPPNPSRPNDSLPPPAASQSASSSSGGPQSNMSQPSSQSSHFVFVRDLPPHILASDLYRFFDSPNSNVRPTNVRLIFDDYGRPTEAKVEFATHQDALQAMKKDKAPLFNHIVDLFLCSKEICANNNNSANASTETGESSNNGNSRQFRGNSGPYPSYGQASKNNAIGYSSYSSYGQNGGNDHSSANSGKSHVYGSNYSYDTSSNNNNSLSKDNNSNSTSSDRHSFTGASKNTSYGSYGSMQAHHQQQQQQPDPQQQPQQKQQQQQQQPQQQQQAESQQASTGGKNYSFYGMVPSGWQSSYNVGPAGVPQYSVAGAAVGPSVGPPQPPPQAPNYGYGAPPPPPVMGTGPVAPTAAYGAATPSPYSAYPNPYFAPAGSSYGQYGGYGAAATAPAAPGGARGAPKSAASPGGFHTIRKEPINYPSR